MDPTYNQREQKDIREPKESAEVRYKMKNTLSRKSIPTAWPYLGAPYATTYTSKRSKTNQKLQTNSQHAAYYTDNNR